MKMCQLAILILSQAVFLLTGSEASAQTWQRVVNVTNVGASAIGGGGGNTVFSGLNSGHVFRSDDNGLTWSAVTNGLVDKAGAMLLPKAFLVTPTGRVLRGGDNASWNGRTGSPIFRSDDKGSAWTEVPLPFGSPTRNPGGIGISDMVVHQGALYFSDLLSEGVWKSTDNGLTWSSVGGGLPTIPFTGIVKTYYAIASAGEALLTAEPSRGIFRSVDGGLTWTQAVSGIPGLAGSPLLGGSTWSAWDVAGLPDGTAFAVVNQLAYRSRDGGATWAQIGTGLFSARKIEVLGDRVFVTSNDGNPRFFEGTTLGDSWTELPRIPGGAATAGILSQSFAANNGALYFAGTNGVYRLDLGTTARTNLPALVTNTPSGPFFANVGGALVVQAQVQGTAPFQYEWRLNGVVIAGQTSATLRFSPASTNDAGPLVVVVSNAAGKTTNAIGTLNVSPGTVGSIDYSFRPQQNPNFGATVTTFAIAPDGSVYFGGNLFSQTDAYTGVRHANPDGTIDTRFVTGALIGTGTGPGISSGLPSTLLPLGDGSVLVGATDTSDSQRYYRRLLADGSLDATWPWPTQSAGGPWKLMKLADGRILIAGGSSGGIQRLNADGSIDPTFQGPASIGRFQYNYVRDFVVQADGRIIIVGRFNDVDGITRSSIARLLPSGSLDTGWVPAQPPLNSDINCILALPDGRLLIGGGFSTVGNQNSKFLARLKADGSVDTSMVNLSLNGAVSALALQPDGKVWVGGAFTGVSNRKYLLRLAADGSLDPAIPDIGLAVPVLSLQCTPDGRVWIGSAATALGNLPAGQLFRIFTDFNGPATGYAGLDQTPDPGTSLTLHGTVTGVATSVQWRLNGTPIPGATSLDLTLSNLTAAASGRYDLIVTSAGGSSTSAPATVRVRGPVVLDQTPNAQTGVVSNTVTLAVTAFGRLPLTYQWSRDQVPIPNATNRTLALTNLQFSASGDYTVQVIGGDGTRATTPPAFLNVVPRPGSTATGFSLELFAVAQNGLTQIRDQQFLPDSRSVLLGSFAKVTNGTNAMLVRIRSDGSLDTSFQFDPSGLIEVSAMRVQPDGRVVVAVRLNEGGGPYALRQLLANGSVDPGFRQLPLNSAPPTIAIAPDGGILVATDSGLTRVTPAGQVDSAFAGRTRLTGGAQDVAIDPAGRIYAAGLLGAGGTPARSRVVRLLPDGTLDTHFSTTNNFGFAMRLLALPDGVLVSDGGQTLRLNEAGEVAPFPFFQPLLVWDARAAGGFVGASSYTTGTGFILDRDGNPTGPLGRISLPGSPYPYVFLRSAPDGSLWLGFSAVTGGMDPRQLLAKLNGDAVPLSIVSQPASRSANLGDTVALTVGASGTTRLRYQWQRNGNDLAGETNATLTLVAVQAGAAADYRVVVSNAAGSLTSQTATLVVLGAPEILGQPVGANPNLGEPLRLTVVARGATPTTYQWRFNGIAIPGATSTGYTNLSVGLANSGLYDVVIKNARGSVTSAVARVDVVLQAGSLVGGFVPAGITAPKELNLLPGNRILADGTFYSSNAAYLGTLFINSTDVREKMAVDLVRGRLYGSDTPRFVYDLDGNPLPGFTKPNFNFRSLRVEASGKLLFTDTSLNWILHRMDTNGTLLAFTSALTTVKDFWPLPDGRILVLTERQRPVGGTILFDTSLNRINTDGSIDTSFSSWTNSFSLNQQADRIRIDNAGRILLWGTFTNHLTQARSRIARFLPDGALDATFNPPIINGAVTEIAEQANGRLVVVGGFTDVGGLSRNRVARLLPDGSHDLSFDPGTGLGGAGQVLAFDVKVMPSGQLVVAGAFDTFNGVPRPGLALVNGDNPDLSFTSQPPDLTLAAGDSRDLVGAAAGSSTIAYQWIHDGQVMPGETNATLHLVNASGTTAGDYRLIARNAAGQLGSRAAHVIVTGGTATPKAAFDAWAANAGLTGTAALPQADPDGDGINNLGEYVLGTNPGDARSRPAFLVEEATSGSSVFPAVSFIRLRNQPGITTTVTVSSNSLFTDNLGGSEVSVTPVDADHERVVVRSNVSRTAQPIQFIRITIGGI